MSGPTKPWRKVTSVRTAIVTQAVGKYGTVRVRKQWVGTLECGHLVRTFRNEPVRARCKACPAQGVAS